MRVQIVRPLDVLHSLMLAALEVPVWVSRPQAERSSKQVRIKNRMSFKGAIKRPVYSRLEDAYKLLNFFSP
ncbi:hypothetical protein EBQ90_04205 [bacterium]|nr:hypothetical protein [bacterium]